ncbi:fimbrial biogenesis chaperone [Achromobacter agilis]|uniref:Putative fimbrial chaperone YadV n=1 Tax=Achromobacter agilis TaxID=1353888 RepID=A0A446C9H4_9BURK|nr:molecular chaperone [Achromobacter agilis]SSW64572.1 putative fimbrial chaperone YadV [Achromobacter agilis]
MTSFAQIQRVLVGGLAAATLLYGACAQASISLSATRIIVLESKQEASISVRNSGTPVLVQSWLESNTAGTSDDLPFAVTPPLAKVAAPGQQLMRVLYAGGHSGLPRDRESVMWLNVQEIPQSTGGDNQLQIAVRQRIKVFFRPTMIEGASTDAPGSLRWAVAQDAGRPALKVTNPSMYHVSFAYLGIVGGKELPTPEMLAPGETRLLRADGVARNSKISIRIINDFGGVDAFDVQLSGEDATSPAAVQTD